MIETGTGNAAYYADILQAVIILAVTAPAARRAARRVPGPPGRRPGWRPPGRRAARPRLSTLRAAARHLGDIQLRYATLLGRLGPALDGPGTLDEADAWYFILEGTREPSVAEAQALALTELAAHAATSPDGRAARDPAGRR